MYSINKYKLLRHTFVKQSWEWFQRPSSCCLNSVDLNFHQEKSVHSFIVTPFRAATLLLISVLGQQSGVIMYTTTCFTAGLEAGLIYAAHTHRCRPKMTSGPPLTRSFADSSLQILVQVGLAERPPYCLHLFSPGASARRSEQRPEAAGARDEFGTQPRTWAKG